jgi:hypothetical protein
MVFLLETIAATSRRRTKLAERAAIYPAAGLPCLSAMIAANVVEHEKVLQRESEMTVAPVQISRVLCHFGKYSTWVSAARPK